MAWSASKRALGTYELLENVIILTDSYTIQSSRQVSKAWLALIDQSRKIQHAMVLSPRGAEPLIRNRHKSKTFDFSRDFVPWYPDGLKLHPALRKWSAGPGHRTAFDPTECFMEDMSAFVTSPPCTAVGVHTYEISRKSLPRTTLDKIGRYCVVYRPHGVRLRDLWEINCLLQKQARRSLLAEPLVFIGLKSRSTWPLVEEAEASQK